MSRRENKYTWYMSWHTAQKETFGQKEFFQLWVTTKTSGIMKAGAYVILNWRWFGVFLHFWLNYGFFLSFIYVCGGYHRLGQIYNYYLSPCLALTTGLSAYYWDSKLSSSQKWPGGQLLANDMGTEILWNTSLPKSKDKLLQEGWLRTYVICWISLPRI